MNHIHTIFDYLRSCNPEKVSVDDIKSIQELPINEEDICLVFYLALSRSFTMEVISFITLQMSNICGRNFGNGFRNRYFPVKLLSMCSIDIVNVVLDTFPQAGIIFDDLGNTLLHYLVSRCCSIEFIRLVISLCPKSTEIYNELGFLPIHLASSGNLDIEIISLLNMVYPAGISIEYDFYRNKPLPTIPIHLAVANGSYDMVAFLLNAYPEGCKRKNNLGKLPLHIAIESGADSNVIQLLVDCYPEGARELSNDNSLPIHLVDKGTPLSILVQLISLHKDGCMTRNAFGNLPAHNIILSQPYVETITSIMNVNPKCCDLRNNENNLLLHLAARNVVSPQVLRVILKANPKACTEKGLYGWLPIHCMFTPGNASICTSQSFIESLVMLLQASPESVHVANGWKTPIELAKLYNFDNSVKRLLLRAHPIDLTIADKELLKELNWLAKRDALLLVNRITRGSISMFDNDTSDETSRESKLRMIFTNLCRSCESGDSLAVTNDVMRGIISFL